MPKRAIPDAAEIDEVFNRRDFIKIHDLFLEIDEILIPKDRRIFIENLRDSYAREFADDLTCNLENSGEEEVNILHAAIDFSPDIVEIFLPYFDLAADDKIDLNLAQRLLIIAAILGNEESLAQALSRPDVIMQDKVRNEAIALAILSKKPRVVELIFEKIPQFSRAVLANPYALLAAASSDLQTIRTLLLHATNLESRNDSNFSFFDYMALKIAAEKDPEKRSEIDDLHKQALSKTRLKPMAKPLAKPVDEKKLAQEIMVSVAKFMLYLLYKKGSLGVIDEKLIPKIIAQTLPQLDLKDDRIFVDIVDKILFNQAFDNFSGTAKLEIIKSKIQQHASYFVIEYEENAEAKTPRFIYYVDGNCPLSGGLAKGVARFNVKEGITLDDLKEGLLKIDDDFKKLPKLKDSNDLVFHESCLLMVETTIQKRGNCAMKSFMLLCELSGILAHGKEDGQAWHQERKDFKHQTILFFTNQIKDLAKEGSKEAKDLLSLVKENAERKLKKSPDFSAHQLAKDILSKKPSSWQGTPNLIHFLPS